MAFAMGFLVILNVQLGVVLERFQAFVAQEFLGVVKVGSAQIDSVVQERREVCGLTLMGTSGHAWRGVAGRAQHQ